MRRLRFGQVIPVFTDEFIHLIGRAFPPDHHIHQYMLPFTVDNSCNVDRDLGRRISLFQQHLAEASRKKIDVDMVLAADATADFSEVIALAKRIKRFRDIWEFYCAWSNALDLFGWAKEGEPRCHRSGCILYQEPVSSHTGKCYDGSPIPYPSFE